MKTTRHVTRSLSLLLAALLMLLSLFGCGSNGETPDSTTESSDSLESESEVDEAAEALDELGEIDWGGGDFAVIYANDLGGFAAELVGFPDESQSLSSGVINNAVYERNVLFEERCNLTYVQVDKSVWAIPGALQAEVQAGSDSYQFVSNASDQTASFAITGLLGNYLAYDIDFERPWWDQGTLAFNLAGNVFFMSGAHNIVDNDVTYIMAFNKALAEEMQLSDPYATVRGGDWTLEYFLNLVKPLSADNGDGKWDHEDTYGLAALGTLPSILFYGSDLQYVRMDTELDRPVLSLDEGRMERATNVLTIARHLYHEENITYKGVSQNGQRHTDVFMEDRAVFFCEAASALSKFSGLMESDYGILPIPKYDKSQEKYYTWSNAVGSTLSFLTTNEKNEEFGRILEAYVILSHNTVSPAYYETLLKSRNVRDPESVEMLEILFTNRIYDMPNYFTQLGLSNIFTDAVKANTDSFASKYKAAVSRFDRALDQIMRKLDKKDS